MKEIRLNGATAQETLDIVKQLRDQGLVQDVDFNFAFHQVKYDPITCQAMENKHSIFTFYQDKYATLFALRYVVK